MFKEDLLTQRSWTRLYATPMRLALTLLFASLSIGLIGCGAISIDISGNDPDRGGASSSSSVQDSPAELTLNDYVEQCVAYRTDPRGDYATNFEAVGALRNMAERFEMMSPPAEVAEVHRARLRLIDKQIEVLSQNSPDSAPTFGVFIDLFQPELASVWQAYNESQYTLSAMTRELLLTRGCIGSEDEIRKAQPTLSPDEKRSVEEYARWCAEDVLDGEGDYATYGELISRFRSELARYEAVTPPTELASLHEARMNVFKTVINVYGEFPPNEGPTKRVRVHLDYDQVGYGEVTPIFDPPVWDFPELNHPWLVWTSAYQDLRLDTQSILRGLYSRAVLGGFIGGICGLHKSS